MVGDHVKFKWEEWVVHVCVCVLLVGRMHLVSVRANGN